MEKRLLGWCLLGSFLVIGTVVGSFEGAYWKKAYPGVRVGGVAVGNMNFDQIKTALLPHFVKPEIVVTWGTSLWKIKKADIALEYNVDQSAQIAIATGRSGNLIWDTKLKIQSWKTGQNVDPVFILDRGLLASRVASVSAEIDIPAQEPEVFVNQGLVTAMPGENGQEVDQKELIYRIEKNIADAKQDAVEMPMTALRPKLNNDQMLVLIKRAEKIANKKLILKFQELKWEVAGQELTNWLTVEGENRANVERWVDQLSDNLDKQAENALFRYVGEGKVEEFRPGKEGVLVKRKKLVDQLIEAVKKLENGDEATVEGEVPVEKIQPEVTTAQVNNLGIKERIGLGESTFTGSITNRIFNLKKAAGHMNGVLVAPGEVFSFNKYVGDISAQGGYKQAYVIKEGRTVLGDGGGVCQVSTTLFRAVLNAGLPVEERTAHAYRVHYYEENSQPGFDATIFTPSVDFKFKNDTQAYVLIQTKVDETKNSLIFELYGTNDGRVVTLSKARVWDVAAPPPALYQDDPTLPKGVVKQVDWSAWGAKVAFDWKVTRGKEILQERTFYSNFRPWQAVFLRGTR